MDNFKMDIKATGKENLRHILNVTFSINAPGDKIDGWYIDDDLGMVLVWHKSGGKGVEGFNALPNSYDVDQTTEFVWGWLQSDGGKEARQDFADFDGSVGSGFHLQVGEWGHAVKGNPYSVVTILPIYAHYSK